ncbi:hypothetical protein ACC691_16990 [Rhizobium johnstonii]|uniref:hypothetical protein n=1 Tax=Rhizobium johnstonii TaxID=3019933 RepID=UPI003F96075A
MDGSKLAEFKKNIDFIDLMFRMSCASTRMAFGAGLEMLPLDQERGAADHVIEEGRRRLRAAILSQVTEFEGLLKLVDG